MVREVRGGRALRAVARRFKVSVNTVSRWVVRSADQRLDRCLFVDGKSGRAWNRVQADLEQRLLHARVCGSRRDRRGMERESSPGK